MLEECPRSRIVSVEYEPCHRPRFSDEEGVPHPLRLLRPEGYCYRRHQRRNLTTTP